MAITKPPVRAAWGDTAVVGATNDLYDPGTTVSTAGWPLSSVPPPRQTFNWILNRLDNAVRYFSRRGVVDWDAGETYLIGDIVRADNGKLLQSAINANTNILPSTNPASWTPILGYIDTAALATSLASYETVAALTATLASYPTTVAAQGMINTTLIPYATQVQAQAYANAAQLAAENYILAFGYSTQADAQNRANIAYNNAISYVNGNFPSYTFLANDIANYARIVDLPTYLSPYAPLANPNFTGSPRAPTQGTGDNSTLLATTAFVKAVTGAQVHRAGQQFLNQSGNRVNFSSPFPNSLTAVVVCPTGNSGAWALTSWDTSGFNINSGVAEVFHYIAMGT